MLAAVGIPSYFAKAQVALPFLLDLFRLPHDLFQLYIPTTIITGKFDSMVTAMNLFVFALLGACGAGGFLVVTRRRLVASFLLMVGATVLTVAGARVALGAFVDTTYRGDDQLKRMHASREHAAGARAQGASAADTAPPGAGSVMERARRRGTLRIGYDPGNVPFSFFNSDGQLVGFDVELAQHLAESNRLEAEFVPVSWPDLPEMLARGVIDVMPGMWVRPYWFSLLHLTNPYFTGIVGLVVRDERRAGVHEHRGDSPPQGAQGGRPARQDPACQQHRPLFRRSRRAVRDVRVARRLLRRAAPGDRRIPDAR